ncbi:MAG: hypothetical protein JWO80_1392, partial [Bryobacterales bacterium]|nr:hypothetical protein [Bryobacterales bacterium]
DANLYYARSVLPSALSGMLIDPYNPGQGSAVALLRRTFVAEPDLNPHPWIPAPAAFFFLRSLFTLGILAITVLVLGQSRELTRRQIAWLVITTLLLSPVNATYVFALLIVPVALLLPESSMIFSLALLCGLALAGAPLPPPIQPWFPRVWILLALFIQSGWPSLRGLTRRQLSITAAMVAAVSLADASRARQQSLPNIERIQLAGHPLAAMSPAVTSKGLIYQTFGKDRYVLRTGSAEYVFAGHAFHPAASPLGGPVVFELVADGHSRILRFNPDDHSSQQVAGPELDPQEPCVSSDGRLVAFVSRGSLHLNDGSHVTDLKLHGRDPSFTPDGSGILFARAGRIFSVALESGAVLPVSHHGGVQAHPAVSPNGRVLAYVEAVEGHGEIWLQRLPSGEPARLTSDACNNDSPMWEADSHHLIFTSDCGRGLGLPTLYRATLPQSSRPRPVGGAPDGKTGDEQK